MSESQEDILANFQVVIGSNWSWKFKFNLKSNKESESHLFCIQWHFDSLCTQSNWTNAIIFQFVLHQLFFAEHHCYWGCSWIYLPFGGEQLGSIGKREIRASVDMIKTAHELHRNCLICWIVFMTIWCKTFFPTAKLSHNQTIDCRSPCSSARQCRISIIRSDEPRTAE